MYNNNHSISNSKETAEIIIFIIKIKYIKVLTVSLHNPDYIDPKNVYSCFKHTNNTKNNMIYSANNWRKLNTNINQNLDMINYYGGAIWLNAKGDLCYRLSYNDDKILTSTAKKISLVFNNLFDLNIEIREKFKNIPLKKPVSTNVYSDQILTNELLLVKDEYFNPLASSEFYLGMDSFFYRSTFKPTSYFITQPDPKYSYKYSIILQYIYHLSNYKEDRFNYIMNWLAVFFKNLATKPNVALVLIGKKKSAKDILFDEIIQPLFGESYSVKLDDDKLQTKNLSSIVKNKLFYNLNDITSVATENKRSKAILKDIIDNDIITIEEKNKDSLEQLSNFGQTLVTISEPYIPYLDNKCNKHTVFKIPNNIEDMYILESFFPEDMDRLPLTKDILISLIRNDLQNFSFILKSYTIDSDQFNQPFIGDDKDSIIENLDDKLKAFSDAVIEPKRDYFSIIEDTNPSLYKEIMEDFDNDKIKQRNLIKCFTIIHTEEKTLHPRTLMVKLRAISDNNGFFETNVLEAGTGGIKYFDIIS